MSSRTYYDILGVSRDATLEEITSAKNALAKVYHPDANMHKDKLIIWKFLELQTVFLRHLNLRRKMRKNPFLS